MKLIPKITPEIFKLLNFTPLQYMLRSVETVPGYGMIYADDEDEPSTCVVRLGRKLFFGGNATPECLSYLKAKILTFEIYEIYGVFYLFYPNETWRDALTTLFPERCTLRERSLYSAESAAAQTDILSAITPVTSQLMKSDVKNKEMIIKERMRGMNLFFKNDGFGYALLIGGEIQGFCTSEYKSENELAVGIKIAEAYQRKDYAKAMADAFLEKAVGKGYKVYWESWKDDMLSINTAVSCGFQHAADYSMILLDLRDMDRGGRAPEESDVLVAVQKYFPEIETVERVPKGGSTYVYQARTPSEIYYARFYPEDFSFAAEVTAHKLMIDAGIQVPRIVAFEHKESQSGLSMMIASEIPGVSMGEMKPENFAEIYRQAGRQLALIHSIPVDGFGWIDRTSHDILKGEKSSFLAYFDDYIADDLVCLNYYESPADEQAEIRGYMEQARLILDVPNAVLVHGDFSIDHIFHSDGKFSGFIDFGEIRGNNRYFDLATFIFWSLDESDNMPYNHLIDGYRETAKLTDRDLYAVELMALFILLRFAAKKVEQLIEDDGDLQDDYWYGMIKNQLKRIKQFNK